MQIHTTGLLGIHLLLWAVWLGIMSSGPKQSQNIQRSLAAPTERAIYAGAIALSAWTWIAFWAYGWPTIGTTTLVIAGFLLTIWGLCTWLKTNWFARSITQAGSLFFGAYFLMMAWRSGKNGTPLLPAANVMALVTAGQLFLTPIIAQSQKKRLVAPAALFILLTSAAASQLWLTSR